MNQLSTKRSLLLKRCFSKTPLFSLVDDIEMTKRTKDLAASILSKSSDCCTSSSNRISSSNSGVEKDALVFEKRIALSKAITLIESHSIAHTQQADLLLNHVTKTREKSAFRVGIAGAPGSGKSSLIEALGTYILDHSDHSDDEIGRFSPEKIAVVCVDPSSSITGGSILGDKTRMMELSRHPRAFVRPSPSKGVLGGLTSYTNDVVSLCEAAGYELVLVETVGLGQSEIDISQTVDMIVLIVPPGGGDGLQGAKKGILEVADMLVVNKADGQLLTAARTTAADYIGATHYFRSRMEGWETPPVLLASAETGDGLEDLWKEIQRYREVVINTNALQSKRSAQARYWMWKTVQDLITNKIKADEDMKLTAEALEIALEQGNIAPRAAASKLLDLTTRSLAKGPHTDKNQS
jgi:LAO/AO transport system kinase